MPKDIPTFYSKTLVNTEKMLESTDFACTLKETKTTIPISRTPKPISEFGLKPGKYRPSAVKIAGFDPLDANHAASTGVGSLPVLDRTCKQGKENTGMRDNQTTRRMPMIVTAMACATASMLAGLALGPSAMAADTTITLQGADGASLAGHTFNVYQIGTYTGVVLKGNQISSLGIQGTTESNAWADDAITIANGYDKDTSDDITKVGGYDAAGSIAAIDMAKQAKQLSNIQAALNASSRKPATVAGGADLTTQDATLNITVPEEGLYYITDSAGSPIIIGTKSGAGTAMSGAPGRTLGVAVIKSKSVTTDKKVVVDRDGRQVSKQGDAADPVAVTVGDTVTHTIDVTVPNTAVKFKLADAPAGQEYVKGSLKVALSGTATDVTADTVIYDGETQHGAKALPGDATLKKEDRTPADPDITVPAGGWALNATKLITTQGGKKITITYQSVITKATAEKPSENSVSGTAIFKDGAHYTVVTNGDKVDLKSYDFTLKKVSAADVNTLVDGAEFQIQRGDKYLKLDTTTGEWSEAADQASATTFTTGDSNNDGKVDHKDNAAQKGLIAFKGLGYGTYTVTETKEPAGYASYAKPSFTVTIDDAGTAIRFAGKDQPGLTTGIDNNTVQVKNITNLTQLPQTGGALAFAFWLAVSCPLWGSGIVLAERSLKNRRKAVNLAGNGLA
ncbi:Cna protein B-type domain protein [Bifidobacterium longum subsp. longum 1-6B]|uniref:Cna protein B-type domain protein n=2 Tax=Bifidobacterium longum TaxID=216816 RepID=A0AA87LPG5_BIFLL|nr:Cna protein B-type domain protein [Bifidobacterium longum subsp. longum 1-6B]EIJ30167.1 Cna protein B-type domain protein [Bifidobacterium longum subsp. longum 44B]